MVEVLSGIAVVGLVLALGSEMVIGVAGRSQDLERRELDRAREARARAWLRIAFASLQVGLAGDDVFVGQAESVSFATRLQTPGGWFETRTVSLRAREGRLIGIVGSVDTFTLAERVESLEAHYLAGYGEAGEWLRGWQSPATAPLAVRLVIARHRAGGRAQSDTLVLPIGPRS
ncbi:MAG: hypothetical protein IT352_03310 [Gemmatimonadales bacterium]|nr:hypothetical protein [Gemmatimonadales bacterium]